MNEIIINDKPLPIREYKGNRVVTFKEIDEVHGRKDGTARKRFNDNKKRFIEGVDYFNIQKSEKRTLGFDVPNRGLILVTESGYLMLVKSFSDDLAWTVQRELVNFYFRGRTPAPKPKQLTLETNEYTYTPKTYKGEPVITLADFEHFTGVKPPTARYILKNYCERELDYITITRAALAEFKEENPDVCHAAKSITVLTKRGVETLKDIYDSRVEIPMAEEVERQTPAVIQPREPLPPREPTMDEILTAIDVFRYLKYIRMKFAREIVSNSETRIADIAQQRVKFCDDAIREIASYIGI